MYIHIQIHMHIHLRTYTGTPTATCVRAHTYICECIQKVSFITLSVEKFKCGILLCQHSENVWTIVINAFMVFIISPSVTYQSNLLHFQQCKNTIYLTYTFSFLFSFIFCNCHSAHRHKYLEIFPPWISLRCYLIRKQVSVKIVSKC